LPSCGSLECYVIGLVSGKTASLPQFFGSALSFLAMLFAAAAVIGAIMLLAPTAEPNELTSSATFRFARAAAYIITDVYATKMPAVFMISTSTVAIYTGIAPRWIAFIGGTLMPPAVSPPNIRTATAAVGRAPSAGENIGPPTISPSKRDSSNEKMGALATS
jgi:hypothetical protein